MRVFAVVPGDCKSRLYKQSPPTQRARAKAMARAFEKSETLKIYIFPLAVLCGKDFGLAQRLDCNCGVPVWGAGGAGAGLFTS
jgi:hypothetical protein